MVILTFRPPFYVPTYADVYPPPQSVPLSLAYISLIFCCCMLCRLVEATAWNGRDILVRGCDHVLWLLTDLPFALNFRLINKLCARHIREVLITATGYQCKAMWKCLEKKIVFLLE